MSRLAAKTIRRSNSLISLPNDASRIGTMIFPTYEGGKFTAIGSSAEIRALIGPRTQVYDAKGMTVGPGFVDCHNHAAGEVLLYEVLVGNPFEVEFVTIASIMNPPSPQRIGLLRATPTAPADGSSGSRWARTRLLA